MNTSALRLATDTFASYLSEVTPGDLTSSTPCEGWNVADLCRHMIEENKIFGRTIGGVDGSASMGTSARLASGLPVHQALELEDRYRRTAAFMEQSFGAVADSERTLEMPGIPGTRTVQDLYEMQLCDTVVHTWDLAKAIGFEYEPDPGNAQTVLIRLKALPASARGDGKAFRRIQEEPGPDAGILDQIVLLSGRTP